MSIKNRAVLFELNISSYTGSKKDTKTAEEVTANKSAMRGAASVNKHLFNNVKELEDINKFVGLVRAEFYRRTLPWSDVGQRIVTMESFFSTNDWLAQKETEFFQLVDTFIKRYSGVVAAQAFQLGDMFDRSEYPTETEVLHKFKFRKIVTPIPEAGDFRVDVEENVREELALQYEKVYAERTNLAMNDLWDRLHTTLKHISERLTPVKEGKNKIIRDAVVDNAVELCELLKLMNVTNDKDLESARVALEKSLKGIDGETLRESDEIKTNLKGRVDAILDNFNW